MMALDGGRIGIASQALGLGRAAIACAAETLKGQRVDQGRQWPLADAAMELDGGRLLTLRAAWLKGQRQAFTREASMAKAFTTEAAWAACNRALEVVGPAAYTQDHPLERYLRDVRVTMIYEGTSEVQRIVLGRAIEKRFAGGAR